jgi:hypothetical protein
LERGSDNLLANPFLTTCVSATITEAHIALVGVSLWAQPALQRAWVMRIYRYQDRAPCLFNVLGTVNETDWLSMAMVGPSLTCTEHTNNQIVIASFGLWVTALPITALVVFYLWSSLCCCRWSDSKDGRAKAYKAWYDRALKWFSFVWFFLAGSFAFSWVLWSAFLNGTSDQGYCISNINALDGLFIGYPLVLAIWRQII